MMDMDAELSGRAGNYRVSDVGVDDGLDYSSHPLHKQLLAQAVKVKDRVATTLCACLDSIPSFALVVMAVVLITLLVAAIPLAFALTYMGAGEGSAGPPMNLIHPIRDTAMWPKDGVIPDSSALYQSASILPPNVTGCHNFGFTCTNDPNHVIGTYQHCDGKEDCNDGSDELDCQLCLTSFSCSAREGSGQKKCLRGEALCNGKSDCWDNSDEDETHCRESCESSEFACASGDRCLANSMRCDGDEHCADGSDERGCTSCKNLAKMCMPESKCIPKWKLCDGTPDCSDGSDELECNCTSCSGTHTALCNGKEKMCLRKSMVCDGHPDCPDGEDELKCPGSCVPNKKEVASLTKDISPESQAVIDVQRKYAGSKVSCGVDGEELEWQVACDGHHPKCDANCEECNPEFTFTCETKDPRQKCLARSMLCDGNDDCVDGSDEANCDCKAPGMTMCKIKGPHDRQRCYSEKQRCDGVKDCPDGDDEAECESCRNNAFHCTTSKTCVPSYKRCDGVTDCRDMTDELKCTCEECNAQPFHMYMCSSGDRCYRSSEVCSPTSRCPVDGDNKRDKLFCATRSGSLSYF